MVSDPRGIIWIFVSTYLKVMGTIPLNKLSTFFLMSIDHLQQNYHRRRNFVRTKLSSDKYTSIFNLNGIHTGCLVNMNIVFCRLRGQDGTVDVSGCNKISSSWEKGHQARFIGLHIRLTKLRECILECIHIGSPSESIGIRCEEVLQPNKYSITLRKHECFTSFPTST